MNKQILKKAIVEGSESLEEVFENFWCGKEE